MPCQRFYAEWLGGQKLVGKIERKKHMIITISETDVCSYGYSSIYVSLRLTLGTKIFIQWGTGKTCSEKEEPWGLPVQTTKSATGTSPSEAGVRVSHFLNKKRNRPTDREYIVQLFSPSMGRWWLFKKTETIKLSHKPHPSLGLSQFLLHVAAQYPYKREKLDSHY